MIKNLIVFMTLISSFQGKANEIHFFEDKINYWNQNKNKKPSQKPQVKKESQNFNWDKHLNPENDEFFKEGNHIPPAPFMEVARRPTKENIDNYFAYIKKKNDIMNRLRLKIADYQKKKGVNSESKAYLSEKSNEVRPNIDLSHKKISITTFFLTTCSACHRMFKTLEALQNMGVYVEGVQIDIDSVRKTSVLFPVRMATEKEIATLKAAVHAVPFSIVRKEETTKSIEGFRTINQILQLF